MFYIPSVKHDRAGVYFITSNFRNRQTCKCGHCKFKAQIKMLKFIIFLPLAIVIVIESFNIK